MDAKKFGAFIADQRKQLGLTQAQLAEQLHVTDKAVSRWERGQGFPDINSIEPLSEALRVSIAEIMKGEKSASALSDADVSSAVRNIICLAALKRREHQGAAAAAASTALLLFCVLWIDNMGLMGFAGVVLPCFGLAAGIVLACAAVIRRSRRLPIKITLLWAAALAAIPVIFAVLLFLAGASGAGPVPN